jgi:DNA gyrase subunit A
MPLINFIKVDPKETVTAMVNVSDFARGGYFVLATKLGEVKRIKLDEFAVVRSTGLIAMQLEGDDELVAVRRTTGNQDIMVFSHAGLTIRFPESQIRSSSRNSGGIKGMRLPAGDAVVAAAVAEIGAEILIVSERGFAKRTDVSDFPVQGRGGGGVKAMGIAEKNGPVVAARTVRAIDEIMVISAEGQVLRTAVEGISKVGRTARGVILLNLDATDRVAAIAIINGSEERFNANGNGHSVDDATVLNKPRARGKPDANGTAT